MSAKSSVVLNADLPRELQTERLRLRRWLPSDLAPFAALNADTQVMEFFPAPLSQTESVATVDRIQAHFQEHGFGLWAVEIPAVTPFAGFIGLSIPRFKAHFTPCIEIGWCLAAEHWGQGYATEGARAALAFGFQWLALDEIVSFTIRDNFQSRRVMDKLGMSHNADDDFDHPLLPAGHPLQHHVLYRIAHCKPNLPGNCHRE